MTRGVDPQLVQRLINAGRAHIMSAATPKQLQNSQPKETRAKGVHKAGVMNKHESGYARYLESQKAAGTIKNYWFEAVKLRLAPKTSFTGDFLVERMDGRLEIHEVKPRGKKKFFAHEDAWLKLKIVAEMYPCFTVLVVWPTKEGHAWETQKVG